MPRPSALTMLLMILAAGFAFAICGCSNPKVVAGEHVIVDCAKQDAATVAADAVKVGVLALIAGKVDDDRVFQYLLGEGSVIGGCAYRSYLAELHKLTSPPAGAASSALTVAGVPGPVAQADALLAKLSARWGGVTWTN